MRVRESSLYDNHESICMVNREMWGQSRKYGSSIKIERLQRVVVISGHNKGVTIADHIMHFLSTASSTAIIHLESFVQHGMRQGTPL
jgi:hypothetical protein